ncbi:GFA family protein [Arsenophonus sp. ENCA]|nr:GFA family protein [Arsenophonus sp. ENCA]
MTFIVENGLSIEGKYYVSYCRYSIWLMRIFFHKYGTHLFSKMLKPESYYANAVLFEKSKMGFLVTQFYVGCNPLHYNLIEKTALFTEQHILNT